jgi:ATP-binding cassette, subfamily B, bacterial
MNPPRAKDPLSGLLWPADRILIALRELSRQARSVSTTATFMSSPERDTCSEWSDHDTVSCAAWELGLKVARFAIKYGEVDEVLRHSSASLMSVCVDGVEQYLAIVGTRGASVALLTEGGLVSIRRSALCNHIAVRLSQEKCRRIEAHVAGAVESPRHRDGLSERLRRGFLGDLKVGDYWCFLGRFDEPTAHGPRPTRKWSKAVKAAISTLVGVSAAFVSWSSLARGALRGTVEQGWLWAWALGMITAAAVQLYGQWVGGGAGVGWAIAWRERLFQRVMSHGCTSTLPAVAVYESRAVDVAAFRHVVSLVVAGAQLVTSGALLWHGATGPAHTWLLVGWLVALAIFALVGLRRRIAWNAHRVRMTATYFGGLTRLDACSAERGDDEREGDAALDRYLTLSREADSAQSAFWAACTKGWLVLGLAGLFGAISLRPQHLSALYLSLGGILLADGALGTVANSLEELTMAWASWWSAHGARGGVGGDLDVVRSTQQRRRGDYRMGGWGPCAPDADVGAPWTEIYGEKSSCARPRAARRILIGGHLDEDKFAFVRTLLANNCACSTSAAQSRRICVRQASMLARVVVVPPPVDNHVFDRSLAFNLLMLRRWPPSEGDLRDAERVARKLGLGPLLDRLPSGLEQAVGDSGWPLSSQEVTRLYLARAVLQAPQVLVLDDCLNGIDASLAYDCLRRVRAMVETVVVALGD